MGSISSAGGRLLRAGGRPSLRSVGGGGSFGSSSSSDSYIIYHFITFNLLYITINFIHYIHMENRTYSQQTTKRFYLFLLN